MNRVSASVRAIHVAVPATVPVAGMLHVVLVALLAAGIDMAASMIYWQMQGVAPFAVPRTIAAWVLGPHPPATAFVIAAGFATHYLIYLAMTIVFRYALARRGERGSRRTRAVVITGAVYGVIAYVAVYMILVPALVFPQRLNQSPEWIATCVLLHGVILGPLMAWLLGTGLPRRR